MNKELAEKLANIMEMDYDVEVREYSGRGMYGKQTWAITGDFKWQDILQIVIMNANEFIDEDGEPIFDYIGDIRSDSMGLGTVIY